MDTRLSADGKYRVGRYAHDSGFDMQRGWWAHHTDLWTGLPVDRRKVKKLRRKGLL